MCTTRIPPVLHTLLHLPVHSVTVHPEYFDESYVLFCSQYYFKNIFFYLQEWTVSLAPIPMLYLSPFSNVKYLSGGKLLYTLTVCSQIFSHTASPLGMDLTVRQFPGSLKKILPSVFFSIEIQQLIYPICWYVSPGSSLMGKMGEPGGGIGGGNNTINQQQKSKIKNNNNHQITKKLTPACGFC